MEDLKRCKWCQDNGINQKYHDEEWGIPLHDERKQFEFLMMEVMQCGLNWNMMLKKRETFRACFHHFDYEKVAEYGEEDIERIMNTPGMIRSRRKIKAIIHNAKQFIKIQSEFSSFDQYLWGYSDNKTLLYHGHKEGRIPAKNQLSDRISKDLKRRGFKYMGSITVYSHLQACGIINDHIEECFRYDDILSQHPVVYLERENEG